MRWIYELRVGLEPVAATLAAARATPQQLARGDALLAGGPAGGARRFAEPPHRRRHAVPHVLVRASGNRLFVDTMGQIWHHLRRAMREVLQHREYRKAIWTEHAHIQRAIAAGDGRNAAALVHSHLMHAAVNVQVLLPDGADRSTAAAADDSWSAFLKATATQPVKASPTAPGTAPRPLEARSAAAPSRPSRLTADSGPP
jgi:DNA-binding FadR family transcriptional regulator